MPTTLPQSVQETLGEQAAGDFARWLDENFEQRTVHRDEYREVLSRLDVLEERFDHVEQRFDRMEAHFDEQLEQMETRFDERLEQMEAHFNERFKQVDQRFEQMGAHFNERFEQVDQRFEGVEAKLDRMNDRILSMTRWLIGLIALFGSLVTALLAVAQFGG